VIALGGGVVGDLAGFAAAVFMRGVDYIQIPTTLLAMVDSSVGGKTAVNLFKFKNMAGSFKQPGSVFIDLAFLKTLPLKHITSGLGEVAKTALLDAELFDFASGNVIGLVSQNRDVILRAVELCLKIKSGIVTEDEKEAGLRRRLNAGHTFGHALETLFSYKAGHGEYVLNGMYFELILARALGIADEEYAKNVFKFLDMLLPRRLTVKKKLFPRLLDISESDKKNRDGGIAFVLPVRKGEVREAVLTREELLPRLDTVFAYSE
jgi:3-dehydroquinate synthase